MHECTINPLAAHVTPTDTPIDSYEHVANMSSSPYRADCQQPRMRTSFLTLPHELRQSILALSYDFNLEKQLKRGLRTEVHSQKVTGYRQCGQKCDHSLGGQFERKVADGITEDENWVMGKASEDVKAFMDSWMADQAFSLVCGAFWTGGGKWEPCCSCSKR